MSNVAVPVTDGSDPADTPVHGAVIIDGNGRWAAARGLPRAEGHRRGVEALRRVVRAANELGILYLTIFSFSSENWSRPATEIGDLFGLLRRFIRNDLATLPSDVRARSPTASVTRRRSMPTRSVSTSTRPIFPIPI